MARDAATAQKQQTRGQTASPVRHTAPDTGTLFDARRRDESDGATASRMPSRSLTRGPDEHDGTASNASVHMCDGKMAHPTRFERVSFAFGGLRHSMRLAWN